MSVNNDRCEICNAPLPTVVSLLMDMGKIAALCEKLEQRMPIGVIGEIRAIALSNYHPGFKHDLPERYKPKT